MDLSLVEFTPRVFWFDMVFGLLEGRWLFNDDRSYVLSTPDFWEECMKVAVLTTILVGLLST